MSLPVRQLVHTLSYGDAISGEVLAIKRVLTSLGIENEINAINVHPVYSNEATRITHFDRGMSGEIILHYSLGSPLNELYRLSSTCRRTLIFHNLTPPHWFAGVNQRLVDDLEQGWRELPELCRISDRLLADSTFSANELAERGFRAEVLPLPFDNLKWGVSRNQGIFDLVKSEQGIHLLHVGRLVPNKCVEDIIKTFFFIHHHIDPRSRLWLVGIDTDSELYAFALRNLVDSLHLEHAVRFTGRLADSELRALYEACDAYMCMSEHEGFCMPLIEAMSFGMPVVAFDSSAVSETLGDGGILVSEKRHAEIAELMVRVVRDGELRQQLSQAATRRSKEMSFDRFATSLADLFSQSPPHALQAG